MVQITLTQAQAIDLEVGLLALKDAYRDRGDEELTQTYTELYKAINAQLEAAE